MDQVCNGIIDCEDRSDESEERCQLESRSCHGKITCQNGECLENGKICDNLDDCLEKNTTEYNQYRESCIKKCGLDEFSCSNGRECVKMLKKCNGVPDCLDKSDELNCKPNSQENSTCSSNEFDCGSLDGSLRCIPSALVCNGINDCQSGNDEKECKNPIMEMCSLKQEFYCSFQSECMLTSVLCNGIVDCMDNSDELNCSHIQTSELKCGHKYVKCKSGCIPMEALCAEENSLTAQNLKSCTQTQISKLKNIILKEEKVSLEIFCQQNACKPNSCPDGIKCINHYSSFTCDCGQKMEWNSVLKKCTIINVCDRGVYDDKGRLRRPCDHTCSNENDNPLANFTCHCMTDQFKLQPIQLDNMYQQCRMDYAENLLLTTESGLYVVRMNEASGEYSTIYALVDKQTLEVDKILSATVEWNELSKIIFLGHANPDGITAVFLNFNTSANQQISLANSSNLSSMRRRSFKQLSTDSSRNFIRFDKINQVRPQRMSLDWLRDRLVIADSLHERIMLLDLKEAYLKTLISVKNNIPNALKVDVNGERLIWAKRKDYSNKSIISQHEIYDGIFIGPMNTMGTLVKVLPKLERVPNDNGIRFFSHYNELSHDLTSSYFKTPSAIAIDPVDLSVYIADLSQGMIGMLNSNEPSNVSILFVDVKTRLTAMTILNDEIIYVDSGIKSSIFAIYKRQDPYRHRRIRTLFKLNQSLLEENINGIHSLSVYENLRNKKTARRSKGHYTCENIYDMDDPFRKNDCTHICLPTKKFSYGECTCPDYLYLAQDNKTCVNEKGVPDVIDKSGTPKNLKFLIVVVFACLLLALFLGISLALLLAKKNALHCNRKLFESKGNKVYTPMIKVTRPSDVSAHSHSFSSLSE